MSDKAVAMAKQAIAIRERRKKFFNQSLFDEHAWDVLLLLFVAAEEGFILTLDELCSKTKTPPSTFERWVQLLSAQHVVRQAAWPHEHFELTIDARRRMRELLEGTETSVARWH